ncbi:MAG: nitrogen regulation protein NR(II) [Pirellulaceae bacterium]
MQQDERLSSDELSKILHDTQFMHLIMQASPVGMVVVDRSGLIVYANPQLNAWLGYTEDELLGDRIETLVPSAARDRHAKVRKQYSKQPRARTMAEEKELFARRKDGSDFPVDISLHPFESKGSFFVLANVLDATQRRLADALPRERLRAIGEMVSGLAHESRNALQRARASLDLLELDLLDDKEQMELSHRIRRALEDLEHHYDEVKGYAAPIVLDLGEIEIESLLNELLNELDLQVADVSKITIQVDEGAAANLVDEFRLKQVLRNCIENAIQAGSPNGNPIEVRVFRSEDWQVIDIQDHGVGMSPEVAARVFEPFFTTKQKGTGLGLAICRRIIDAHNGMIEVQSTPGMGSTVSIRLPVRR